MSRSLFPTRIETEHLRFEPISHETTDPFKLYEFVRQEDRQGAATEHMPWFRFEHLGHVTDFIDKAEQQWRDHETVRYILRATDEAETLVGLTAYGPGWETRRAGSGIILAKEYWGREYGLERASAFIELTFDQYDLDAFYTTCAATNESSRRMIEKYVDKYGGQHEGLFRQHSSRPDGRVTDQHRFSILQGEYAGATDGTETLDFDIDW